MEQNKVQSVRFGDRVIQFQTVISGENEYLYLSDVQRRFPTVIAFSLNGVQLSFSANGCYQNTEEQRVVAYPNEIFDAIVSETSSSDVSYDRFNQLARKLDELKKTIDRINGDMQEVLINVRRI